MRCRVLQNELLEGQQQQEAAAKELVLLEHILQQQKRGEQIAIQRLALTESAWHEWGTACLPADLAHGPRGIVQRIWQCMRLVANLHTSSELQVTQIVKSAQP